jgi:putative membrane protein
MRREVAGRLVTGGDACGPTWDGWPGGWMVLWWAIGIVVLVLLVRLAAGSLSGSSPRSAETPEQILKRRYVKGEIEREEYQHRLEGLRR